MATSNQNVIIKFEDLSIGEAGILAAKLRDAVLDASSTVEVNLEKEDAHTQDLGTIVILALGTPAVVAVAKGIADFLRREHASIRIEADGTVFAKGIKGDDAARIAEAISKIHSRRP